jgi:hypothetical protein
VAGLIVAALERGSDKLIQHLVGPGQLVRWLTNAPETITPLPRPSDARASEALNPCPADVTPLPLPVLNPAHAPSAGRPPRLVRAGALLLSAMMM